MNAEELGQQIALLRNQLTSIDTQLVKSAGAPEGLEDLKRAVDNLRTSVWAILSASRSTNYPSFIVRFRLRRGIDILRAIQADFDTEGGSTLHAEHQEMQILLQQVHEKIGRLRSEGT